MRLVSRGFARMSLALLAGVGVVQGAAAAEATPSSRLVYVRSPDASACGDESVLRSAVARRFGYDPFFPWARQTVIVQISHPDRRYRAQVQVVGEAGVTRGAREITSDGDSCDELLGATALAISIALDASQESGASTPAPQSSASDASPAPTPPAAATPAPSASTSETRTPQPVPTPTPTPHAPPPISPFVGADLLATVGTAPSPSAGLSLFGGLRSRRWSAALELRADAPAGAHASEGAGSVSSWLLIAALVPCFHLDWASLCAVAATGTLQAQGSGVTEPASGSSILAFAGLRVGTELTLTPALSLRLRLEGLVDGNRPTLDLGTTNVWSAPLFAADVGAGLVVRIP